jgi:hypothetical protein
MTINASTTTGRADEPPTLPSGRHARDAAEIQKSGLRHAPARFGKSARDQPPVFCPLPSADVAG